MAMLWYTFAGNLRQAFRQFVKLRGYFAVQVICLAVGIACFFTILIYLARELTFDRFQENSNRIYRIIKETVADDGKRSFSKRTPADLAARLKANIPEIETSSRVWNREVWSDTRIRVGDQRYICHG